MTPRGQASDKPRGRKPREAPARSGEPTLLWGFDCSQLAWRRGSGEPARRRHRSHAAWWGCEGGFFDDASEEKPRCSCARQSRPLSVPADEEQTHRLDNRCLRSCCSSQRGRGADRFPARKGLDDAHRCMTVWADEGGRDEGEWRLNQRRRLRCGGNEVQ